MRQRQTTIGALLRVSGGRAIRHPVAERDAQIQAAVWKIPVHGHCEAADGNRVASFALGVHIVQLIIVDDVVDVMEARRATK